MRIQGPPCPVHEARRLANATDVPALMVERAHESIRYAAKEGRHSIEVLFVEPEERTARPLVIAQLRRDGFKVRRYRWPLRWLLDGAWVSW